MTAKENFLAAVHQMVEKRYDYRGVNEELVLVLPRWAWEHYGQEQLTASFIGMGIQHVQIVEDWQPTDKVQLLLYAKGTWHTGHGIGERRSDCEGCE